MKVIFIFVLALQAISFFSVAQDQSRKFYCPPCNCTNDGLIFNSSGTCPDSTCLMQLLPVEGDYMESKLKFMARFLQNDWALHLYDILILPAILQGIILSLILIFRGTSRLPYFFLASLLIALCLQNVKFYYVLNVLVSYLSTTGGNPEYNIQSLSFPISGVLFIGPSLYFYVRSLTTPEFRFRSAHLMHFVPGLLFIMVNSLIFFGVASPGNQHSSFVSFLTTISSIENLLAIVLSFYYIFLCIRLMQKHELWVYQHFSATSKKSLAWLKNLIISLSLVWVIWLFAVVINFFTGDFILTYLSSYPFQVATAIIIFWVGYVGFIQGEIFSMEISLERKMEHLRSASKKGPETGIETKNALLKSMETDRLFLIPDLTLAMLGQHLSISPKSISHTLNHELNKNFHDFVNEYRVEEVKKRLLSKAYDHLTILAIALDSGFNSKSSFNRIFTKVVGVTPKEFKKRSQEPGVRSQNRYTS